MSDAPPIAVVAQRPPRNHPLAAALRATIERVARRPGVELRDDGTRGTAARAIWIGLEAPAESLAGYTVALLLDAPPPDADPAPPPLDAPTWAVPADAFGQPLDGLTRVHRLGSLLAAVIDRMQAAGAHLHPSTARPDQEPLWSTPGLGFALAASAHLSAPALRDNLARRLLSRAHAVVAAELDDGRAIALDAPTLPPALDPDALAAHLDTGVEPESLRRDALAAAERFSAEVRAATDRALALHGLAALAPLQRSLDRVRTDLTLPDPAPPAAPAPHDGALRATQARLARIPHALPGTTLLTLAWAAPAAALTGLALGPALDASVTGGGHALAATLGGAAFLALSGAARLATALRRALTRRARDDAQRDLDQARRAHEHHARRALAPALVRGARTWLASELDAERDRLAALERHSRRHLASAPAPLTPQPTDPTHATDLAVHDLAVDLRPAEALLDPRPEPLVQRLRHELAGDWRHALPTLLDPLETARELVGPQRAPPWLTRSDVAAALRPPLATALASLDRALGALVPHGLPARRLALLPAPFSSDELDLRADRILQSSRDAHVIICWRPS